VSTRTVPDDDRAVHLLREMVAIPSPSGSEGAVAAFLAGEMQDLGFDAEIDRVGNVVGRIGPRPDRVAMVGHIDTVPGQIQVRIVDHVLWGRGSVDAKGPMAAFVVAAARAAGVSEASATVVGAVEEEAATSKGAYHLAESPAPGFCIIGEPSGWHRITLGYKGRLLLDYALERPCSHSAGADTNVCEDAVAFWQRIVAVADAHNVNQSKRFNTLDPSLRHIRSSSDGLTQRVEMSIGLRVPPEYDVDELIARALTEWRDDADVLPRGREAPFRAEKRTPLTSAFLAAIRAEGARAAYVTKTGTSDMNVLGPRWRCPMVAYGPGDSSLDHTPEERLDLDEYLHSIRVLTRVLERLAPAQN